MDWRRGLRPNSYDEGGHVGRLYGGPERNKIPGSRFDRRGRCSTRGSAERRLGITLLSVLALAHVLEHQQTLGGRLRSALGRAMLMPFALRFIHAVDQFVVVEQLRRSCLPGPLTLSVKISPRGVNASCDGCREAADRVSAKGS